MPMAGLRRCLLFAEWVSFQSLEGTEDAKAVAGSFIPITLEQLARERGVLSSDHSQPCTPGSPGFNMTSVNSGPAPPRRDAPQCIVHIFGLEVNTASFAMYTFSISVLVQALLIISMSGAADHGRFRKKLLLGFALVGALATMLFLPLTPKMLLLASLCAIVANTCYGASSVLLNSFLPLRVRNHPDIQEITPEEETDDENGHDNLVSEDESLLNSSTNDPSTALLGPESKPVPQQLSSVQLQLATRISSYGIGIGYIAALLLQTSSIYIVYVTHSQLFSLRLVLFLVGLWWALFTIPAALWLRPRPGSPLRLPFAAGRSKTVFAYATYSWKSLGRSIMRARKLKDVLLFLAAWFLLSDAIATVSGTAVLFAKTSLQMQPAALALINVVVTLSGIVGAFSWRRVAQLLGLTPIQTVLACIALFELVPIYGLLGYLPFVKRWGVGGLQQGWEMYPVGMVFGLVLGGLSSFCRALFGELVPPGFEAAFYALYAITDKGSSVFGPAIVGAITDATGEIRPVSNQLSSRLIKRAPTPKSRTP
jgi:UMF1 family MFS transporter